METKSFKGEFKAAQDGDAPGTFEAIVSVFGNVDSVGDRMVKGAFERTLKERGLPPVVWSHEWQVPPIGALESATETDEGLLVKGRFFIGADEDHAIARQVYTAMKAGALKEFSFGYATKGSRDVEEGGETIREITDVDLFEAGPTLVGANPETRLVGVKALETAVAAQMAVDGKAGRVLSKANETKLAQARELLNEVIATVGQEDEDPKNLNGDTAVEKKDSTQDDKDPTKELEQSLSDEESGAEDRSAVLLADQHDRRSTASSKE